MPTRSGWRRNQSGPETVGDSEAVDRDGGSAQEAQRDEWGDENQPTRSTRA